MGGFKKFLGESFAKPQGTGGKVRIDLDGPQGNAFYIMGVAKDLAKKMGVDWEKIKEEMKAGDYKHLLTVFDREFGDHVVMHTSNPALRKLGKKA